ncbi:coiled-coil domain-containing protein [Symbiopectobacterium sp. Eva_TO]
MGQVAFDTLQASEELETAGISREQARAISLVVRKSHEVADVATKRDLEDVRKEIDARFDKTDAHIADIRKDMDARFEKHEAQMQARFEKTEAQIADVRKDMTTQISLVRKDLQLEMAGIRSEQKLIRWMLSAGVLGILSLVVKAFLVTAL